MQKAEKQQFVKKFNETLKEKDFLVVAHYKGLTVSEISSLRQKIKSANSIFKVSKNTLLNDAILIAGGPRSLSGKIVFVRYNNDGSIDRRNFKLNRRSPAGSFKNPS